MKPKRFEMIPALSLDQPFAHMIAHLKMNVESRTWTTKRRGTIAIHATAKPAKAEFAWVQETFGLSIDSKAVDRSCVVAIANLVDVITEAEVTRETRKWFIGPYGFVLEDIVTLKKPVPVKGNRKFWHLKGKALSDVLAQLTASQLTKLRLFEEHVEEHDEE